MQFPMFQKILACLVQWKVKVINQTANKWGYMARQGMGVLIYLTGSDNNDKDGKKRLKTISWIFYEYQKSSMMGNDFADHVHLFSMLW